MSEREGYTRHTIGLPRQEGSRIEILVSDAGEAAYFASLIPLLLDKHGAIGLSIGDGPAKGRLEKEFADQLLESGSENVVDAILVAARVNQEEPSKMNKDQLREIIRLKEISPEARVIIVEEAPGSTRQVWTALTEHNIEIDLWLLPTVKQREVYEDELGGVLDEVCVVPVGQPAFDSMKMITDEEINIRLSNLREDFEIDTNTKVVIFGGSSSHHTPGVESSEDDPKDLASLTRNQILEEMATIAQKRPEEKFALLFKPHPAEPEDYLWKVTSSMELPENVKLISRSRQWWGNDINFSTAVAARLADIFITSASTIVQEVALASALSGDSKVAAFYHLPDDTPPEAMGAMETGSIADLDSSYTPMYNDRNKLGEIIERYLYDEDAREELFNNQLEAVNNYRFRTKSTAYRVFLWINALEARQLERVVSASKRLVIRK